MRRAYLQQRSTYETLGAMAAETLPSMKAVLKPLLMQHFCLSFLLAVLPFWVEILKLLDPNLIVATWKWNLLRGLKLHYDDGGTR